MLDIVAGAASAAETSSAWTMFDSTATVVGFLAAVLSGLGWLVTWYRLRGMTKAQGQLEQMQSTLLLNYNTALEENKRLAAERDEWMPRKWLEAADREVASGNDFIAVDILDAGYRRVREDLALVVHRLAEYHTSRMIGFDASFEHETARRLSRVAAGLAPSNRNVAELANDLSEIEIVDGEPLQIAGSRFDAADPEEASRVMEAARRTSLSLIGMGRYRAAALLSARAMRLAKRHGLESQLSGFFAHYNFCQALLYSGEYHAARSEVETLLRSASRSLGSDHPDVLGIGMLRALAEMHLGHLEDALKQLTPIVAQLGRLQGKEHHQTLFGRGVIAQILINLGRNDEALKILEALLPIHKTLEGGEAPNTLSVRFYLAKALARLDRDEEALKEIDALLPLHERVKGKDHPDMLATQSLKADALIGMGKEDEALTIISAVIDNKKERLGPSHLNTLTSELVRLEILTRMGNVDEARSEIERVYQAMLAATGPDHTMVERAAALRDKLKPKAKPKRARKTGDSGKTGQD